MQVSFYSIHVKRFIIWHAYINLPVFLLLLLFISIFIRDSTSKSGLIATLLVVHQGFDERWQYSVAAILYDSIHLMRVGHKFLEFVGLKPDESYSAMGFQPVSTVQLELFYRFFRKIFWVSVFFIIFADIKENGNPPLTSSTLIGGGLFAFYTPVKGNDIGINYCFWK